jgi:hypothetical protein
VSDRYYTDWDRWFAEEHDGSPVEWLICEGYINDEDEPNNISLCATRPDGHKPLDFERHVVLHRFTASSYIEACNKRNEILGWEDKYIPHPDWDVAGGCWRR